MLRTLEEICNEDGVKEDANSVVFRSQYDMPYFVRRVIGYSVSDFHREQLSLLNGNRFVCLVSPRGHSKTTMFSVSYIIWLLYTQKNIQICLTSASITQSKKILQTIKDIITGNDILKSLIPTDRQDSWSTQELKSSNGNYVFIRPFKPTIRSTHVDYFICDDILRDEEISQDKAKEIFWGVIYPCVNTRKGQLVVVGTPMKTDDLLAELEDKKGWVHRRYSAVIMNDNGDWIRPLWKENFSLQELRDMRNNMGLLKFDREYLCNPMAGGDSFFPEEIVKPQILNLPETITARENCSYFLGLDVALKKGASADFTVFTIIEKDANKICNLVRLERYKGVSSQWQLERIKKLHESFNFRKIQIEERGLSQSLVADAKQDDMIRHAVTGFKTTRGTKERILGELQSGFMTKTLFILNHSILIKELMAFKVHRKTIGDDSKETYQGVGAHDDTVMSLALAYDSAVYQSVGVASFHML